MHRSTSLCWWWEGGVAHCFDFSAWKWGHASRNEPAWLPLHIHVSQRRFIASWHNGRTINVSYVARLSHYRDSLTCCSFKSRMYTAQANKAFWVCGCPLWRDGGLCCSRRTAVAGELPLARAEEHVKTQEQLSVWFPCPIVLCFVWFFSISSSEIDGLSFSFTIITLFFICLCGLSLLMSAAASSWGRRTGSEPHIWTLLVVISQLQW